MIEAAEAPRAASSIRSSSIRCSWVGGTSGWMMNTSRRRQFSWSCACRQSLLNRVSSTELSSTLSDSHTALANGRWALPLKTTISRNWAPGDNADGWAYSATTGM